MNFRPELAAKVMDGTKTVTRRLASDNPRSPWYVKRCGLAVGSDYAVCPGRGRNAVGRVVIQSVTMKRLGYLTEEEAQREGFESPAAFETAFAGINGSYDPAALVWRVQFVREASSETERCVRCSDDGWIDVMDDDDNPIGGQDCPYLHETWHRPFNYSGLLAGVL